MRIVRIIEIIVGALFLLAAALKMADMQSFLVQILYYKVVTSVQIAQVAALGSVAVETLLAVLLLAGCRLRGLTYAATLLVLLAFTGLVGWAWVFNDLKDCGCFGKYVPLGPLETTLKNLAMAITMGIAWWRCQKSPDAQSTSRSRQIYPVAAAGMLAIGIPFFALDNSAFLHPVIMNEEKPFESLALINEDGTSIDLNTGEQLVVMLSATCPDCIDSVEPLNEFTLIHEEIPITGLMLGDEEERQTFIDTTQPLFPVHLIDPVLFVKSTGIEPPRFILLRNGKPVRHLDDLHISIDKLLDFAEGIEPVTE